MDNINKIITTKLQKLIDSLSYKRSIHISIHFLYDFYKNDNYLNIDFPNTYHSCEYCKYIKSNIKGKSKCMKTKNIAVDKAIKRENALYSTCYMGVTEIIVPVIFNNQPIAIVFLGGLVVEENFQKNWSSNEKNINKLDLIPEKALSYYKALEHIKKSELDDYIKMAQTVANYVTCCLNSDSAKYNSLLLSKKGNDNYIIYKIVSYIENNYNNDIRLSDIAKKHFINSQYLSKLFKKTIGINYSEYLFNTRIEHAKILLKETDKNLSLIAYETGFENMSYFCNRFKKKTGITPKEYRNKHL